MTEIPRKTRRLVMDTRGRRKSGGIGDPGNPFAGILDMSGGLLGCSDSDAIVLSRVTGVICVPNIVASGPTEARTDTLTYHWGVAPTYHSRTIQFVDGTWMSANDLRAEIAADIAAAIALGGSGALLTGTTVTYDAQRLQIDVDTHSATNEFYWDDQPGQMAYVTSMGAFWPKVAGSRQAAIYSATMLRSRYAVLRLPDLQQLSSPLFMGNNFVQGLTIHLNEAIGPCFVDLNFPFNEAICVQLPRSPALLNVEFQLTDEYGMPLDTSGIGNVYMYSSWLVLEWSVI